MKKNYFLFTFLLLSFASFAQNVTITKIIETDCGDPYVKAIEFIKKIKNKIDIILIMSNKSTVNLRDYIKNEKNK